MAEGYTTVSTMSSSGAAQLHLEKQWEHQVVSSREVSLLFIRRRSDVDLAPDSGLLLVINPFSLCSLMQRPLTFWSYNLFISLSVVGRLSSNQRLWVQSPEASCDTLDVCG